MTTTFVESSETQAALGITTATSAMSALRASTRREYAAIEAVVPLMSVTIGLDGYRHYLSRTLGFYEPIEAALVAVAGLDAHFPDVALRAKRSRLLRDLEGLAMSPEAVRALPRCARGPQLVDVPSALGCAYVLEGSTLGGLILARHLRNTLGSAVEGRLDFLTSYGADVGPMWRVFGKHVDAYASRHPGAVDAMVRSARSTFGVFADWLRSAGASAATSAPARPLGGLYVVVVDDDEDAREVLATALAQHGAEVATASSSPAALDLLRQRKPDVLVSDIGLPREDGYALIGKVRAGMADGAANVPAVALTAYARAEDARKALAAGFQMHAAKPLDLEALVALVAKLAGRSVT